MPARTDPPVAIFCALLAVAACGGESDKSGPKSPEAPPPSFTSTPTSGAKPEPPRGKLAAAPTTLTLGQFWPTKMCTRGPELIVVSNSCMCDSHMTCSATRRGNVLDLHVVTTQTVCKDCGSFAANCAVPADARPPRGSTRTFRVTVDGKPALDALELPKGDGPAIERCYE